MDQFMTLLSMDREHRRTSREGRYVAPSACSEIPLSEILTKGGRPSLENRQLDFLRQPGATGADIPIFFSGDMDLVERPCVSIVGTRDVSDAGWRRAHKLAKELVRAGVVVVSGLAKGVDTAALQSAIENGGRTIAVIGTPLDKAYPAENRELQEYIYQRDLLISPFREGESVYRSNFPKRNRVMAAISDATVIIEASDTSGTLHQAAECQKLGRWLFILQSLVENDRLSWPKKFIGSDKVAVLRSTTELLDAIGTSRA